MCPNFFLRLNDNPLYVHVIICLSIVHGHLGLSHFLALLNNAAMNMGVQTILPDPTFNSFEYSFGYPEVEFLDHMVVLFLIF